MSRQFNRREFAQKSVQALLGCGALWLADRSAETKAAPAGDRLPIIDTHQHLWDLDKFPLPRLKGDRQLGRNFLMKDYQEAAAGLNIVQAIYMEVDVAPEQQLAEAEAIVDICRRGAGPTVAAVVGGRPAEEGFRPFILRFKDNPYVKGVRQVFFQPVLCRDEAFLRGIHLLGRLAMRFDICLPAAHLAAAVELADRCPDTRFVLDHCGNANVKLFCPAAKDDAEAVGQRRQAADQWRRDIAQLARRKNVVCKISGIVASAPKDAWSPADLAPIVNHCIDEFGPDRVMFGSDWPVCTRVATLRQWVEALLEILRGRDELCRRKLLHDNAARFYGL
jgi:predicted TIM-barrel fold metal-dependent hydrolase